MTIRDICKLIIAIVVAELAGIVGSIFTVSSVDGWYATLLRPEFAPPNWIFGPVWTTLYALMGIAAFLVWKKGIGLKGVKPAIGMFFLQLVLNSLWSYIFFSRHSLDGALIEIGILWLAILATTVLFYRVSKVAAWLLLPYILWVTFAGYLNYSFWMLN